MSKLTKSAKARALKADGFSVKEIGELIGMEPANVHKALRRKCPSVAHVSRLRSTHNVSDAWGGHGAAVPTGKCVAWVVVEGKAQQCGAKCKGQRCKDHPITIARTIHIGAKTGGGLAA